MTTLNDEEYEEIFLGKRKGKRANDAVLAKEMVEKEIPKVEMVQQ